MALSLRTNHYLPFLAFLILLFACFAGGGGSRGDIISLLYLRPVSVVCAFVFLATVKWADFRSIRVPLLLLAALAAILLVQLIPLPPEVWTHLPGHARFAEAANVAGMPQPWRPISVTPDLTLNSLVALFVPLATLLGIAALDRKHLFALLPIIIGASILSAILGVAQLTGPPGGPLYLYRITNSQAAVGLFANRNHQAVLLASTLPMLAFWASLPRQDSRERDIRIWAAAALAIFLLLMIVVTGSRAGLILGAIGLALAFLQIQNTAEPRSGSRRKFSALLKAAPWIIGVAILGAAMALSRAKSIQRLMDSSNYDDIRVSDFPVFVHMARDFFPFGSGFGSFDPIFRIYEPEAVLRAQYLNHAHNDLAELVITGGLPALILLLAFLVWWMRRSIMAFRRHSSFSLSAGYARLGSIVLLLLLLASLVDYPLRTPIMMLLFALACGWLSMPIRSNAHAANGAHRDGDELGLRPS